jgi:asparagine synthase (glutamine-hydrolysing)
MCGFCGIYNYRNREPVDRELLPRQTDTLRHRGPDDRGFYYDDGHGLGLGFRRLSIIDLSPAGRQPMANEDGSVWLVFNGELYDFQEARRRLEAKGHRFRSRTDTEVLLHQYEEQGVDCLAHLNGMFGLALWDAPRQRLVLARDRVGKKPLYYYDDGRRIIFASELKAILADPATPRQLDWEALGEYLALGYVTAPRTIFTGINKLRPGHYLVLEPGRAEIRSYWDWLPAFRRAKRDYPDAEWPARTREMLAAAVKDRLLSDVPLGAFLSGGVDSSAVVALMAAASERPVKTFTIGFADRDYDESAYARLVARRFGAEHHELVVQPENVADLLPRLARQYDEPFADSSAVPTYYVAKLARQHVTVCLSGDGGDEACGGYERYAQYLKEARVDLIPRSWRRLLLRPLAALPLHLPGPRLAQRLLLDPEERYAFAMRQLPPQQVRSLLTGEAARLLGANGIAAITAALKEAADLAPLSRLQYADGRVYLPEDILVKVDRASMLNSLEVRCPLLDYRFLELMAAAPAALHLQNGRGKALLKRALRGLVPDPVLDRAKQGFGVPFNRWFRDDLTGFIRGLLLDRRTTQRGIFSGPALAELLRGQASGRSRLTNHVWVVLMLEMWCREYLDGR